MEVPKVFQTSESRRREKKKARPAFQSKNFHNCELSKFLKTRDARLRNAKFDVREARVWGKKQTHKLKVDWVGWVGGGIGRGR
jgi:hypothetical protein